jgi:hypothetical protein
MQDFKTTKVGSTFHIEGFSDSVKVISICGKDAEKLSDFWLHRFDIRSAKECLEAINHTSENPRILREALWRSAVVFYFKCFGFNQSRKRLLYKEVYKDNRQAQTIFIGLKSLRDKYLVHDENAYSQSFPGAILNKGNKSYKIDRVSCIAFLIETLNQENWNNLLMLTRLALKYIEEQLDKTCEILTKELETKTYDELIKMKPISWMAPGFKQIGKSRK